MTACPDCGLDHPPPCPAAGRALTLAAVARGDRAVIDMVTAMAEGRPVVARPPIPLAVATAPASFPPTLRIDEARYARALTCPHAEPVSACSQWCGLNGGRVLVKMAGECLACPETA